MQIMAMFTAMSRARFCKNFLGSLFFGDTVYKNINKKKKNKLAKLIAKDGVFSSAIIIRIFIAISLVTFCPTAKAAEDGLSLIRDCEIEDFLYQITIPLIKAANLNPSDIKIYIVNDSSLNAFVSGGAKGVIPMYISDAKKIGMKNSFELMQELFVNVGRSTGATIISAAGGTQFALEDGGLKNGVFTYSILEFMKNNPEATISKLKEYVNTRVPELTKGMQMPTSRSETNSIDWQAW